MKTLICLTLVLFALLSADGAAAEPRAHDGFFFRGAASYTPFADGIRGKPDTAALGNDSNATGQGVLFEALAGGTIKGTSNLDAGNMVYGGGMLFATLPSFTLSTNGTDNPASLANTFGIFFFDELYPIVTSRAHLSVQTMLGFANMRFGLENGTAQSANGVLLGVGFTESSWVSDEWSIGLQARAIVIAAGGSEAGVSQSHVAWLPSLGLIATYH